ncbi:MAG: DUF2202 domain-containing protein [Gammaproteobacteria bacterium]|nr:DUF2202 domain-containing protein [Gammaproteobacteria bacterium]MBU2478904.1 DUF2202 domain-containing protein [Gammaproteobacteria bacterium]
MQHHSTTPLATLICAVLLGMCSSTSVSAGAARNTAAPELDATEAAGLTFMREEEKLARDVYQNFYPLWNNTLFDNISQSEQQHFDAIGGLLDRYRLDDPARMDLPGVFQNPELQALYDQLINQGAASTLAALQAGALIEETDIEDIAKAIMETDQPDILRVYENLLRGSRNHLRAFVAAIEASGIPYTAQVLTQEQVDAIIDSPMERGHGTTGR